MSSKDNIHIGYGEVYIAEQGVTAVPEDWSTLARIGYLDPDAGAVLKPEIEIKETKVARFAGAIKATIIGGGAKFECVLMESQIANLAWALGLQAADIDDNVTDLEKSVYGPLANGEVNEFNLMVKQLQAGSSTLYNMIQMPRAYIESQTEIMTKHDEERKLKLSFGLLAVEDSGDWQGKAYRIVEEYEGA